VPFCRNCKTRTIRPRHRVYCANCSPRASAIWKVRHRRQWIEEWKVQGRQGPPPYLDGWPSIEARRAYYREYMRKWRKKRR